MSDKQTRFQQWEEVDCNDCVHYWDDSCNGVKKGQKRGCTAFLATRSVVIPQQIKSLKFDIKCLNVCVIILAIALAIHIIM